MRDPGITVREILRTKRSGIRRAPLPEGSPSWDDIQDWTWQEIEDAAQSGRVGFRTIRKLLTDSRFDK